MKIEWKDIEGYEGLYQVNNIGQVKALDRVSYRKSRLGNRYKLISKGRILKYGIDHMGYGHVRLHGMDKDESGKTIVQCLYVHRLVAKAFLPIPEELQQLPNEKIQINHKDCCKTCNVVYLNEDGSVNTEKSNIEWVTAKQNMNYPPTRDKIISSNISRKKSVEQRDKQGNLIRTWDGAVDVERETRWNCSNISCCARVNRTRDITNCRKAYGFIWLFVQKKNE